MEPYYAHSGQRPDRSDWQLLRDHLRNTAELAGKFAEAARPGDEEFARAAYVAGLLHDLGKYRVEFQEYLKGGDKSKRSLETAHAIYGSAAAYIQYNAIDIAFAIAGHHAGLHDSGMLDSLLNGPKYPTVKQFPDLIELVENECNIIPITASQQGDIGATEVALRHYDLRTRFVFSMLVDADRLNTERWEKQNRLGRPWKRNAVAFQADRLITSLHEAYKKKSSTSPCHALSVARSEIYKSCIDKGQQLDRGFFSLAVPTGGGKTLSSMAFALAHAKKHKMRRVIVVIPYLSIIEQNAREYRNIFGTQYVLEHHSAVDVSNAKEQEQNEIAEAPDTEKAMENWDAPIVVTTSVQFIETLFTASAGKARKLHNIANSVVIFDEVQTLPVHLLEPLLDVLRELNRGYGVSFVFCSATQPGFKKSPALKSGFERNEITPIIQNPSSFYQQLQRVDYQIESPDQPWNWKFLAERLVKETQVLCVVNVRAHAFEAWQMLRQTLNNQNNSEEQLHGLFHLSSAMCAAHRLDLLGLSNTPPPNNIKTRLEKGLPCRVVSTQLIEAGVDIDFPSVFRAMGPLESIVQAAGRCNREGKLIDACGNPCRGRVTVFHPVDAGLPPGIYRKAASISAMRLDPERMATDPDFFESYFSELYYLSPTDHAKRGEHTIQEDRAAWNFRRVAERAKVIDQATCPILVPYGRGRELIQQVRKVQRFDRTTLRKLQRFTVNIRERDYAILESFGALTPLLPCTLNIKVLDASFYDIDRGVVIQERSPGDFVQ